jgi:molecular chaperone DnaK
MKLGEALYRQSGGADAAAAAASGGAGQGTGASAPSDGVVDAEFEEVKDDEGKKKSA